MIFSSGPSKDLVITNIALTLLERCKKGHVISFMMLHITHAVKKNGHTGYSEYNQNKYDIEIGQIFFNHLYLFNYTDLVETRGITEDYGLTK